MTRFALITASALFATLSLAVLANLRADIVPEKSGDSVLRHVVLFKFKEGTTPAQIKEVVDAFRALKGKIDVIKDFEYGTDVSTEGKAEGFTHCFFVTFADEKGRDAYLPHPAHKDFGKLVGPRLEKVLVVDYLLKK